MSIRAWLILLVLSVLLPALGFAGWTVLTTYAGERENLERSLRDTTRALSRLVDRELAHRAAIAKVLSLSIALDDAPDVPPEKLALFEQQARRAMEGLRGWVVLTSDRGELLNTRLPPGTLPARGAHGPAPLREQPAVLPLRADSIGEGLHAAVVEPVRGRGGTWLNIAVTVLPAELQGVVGRHEVPSDWVATLLDSAGLVVARSRGATEYAGRAATGDLRAELTMRREGLHESVSLDGAPVTLYFNTASNGWTYLTGVPRTWLAGSLFDAMVKVAAATALLLALAVVGAFWVSRRISGPIDSLRNAAARLGHAMHVEPVSTGILECDEVAEALAEAALTNRRARDHLEEQVAKAVQQTREAEQRVSQSQRIEALGRLTGGVAHDFNNLLGVVSNSAHVIKRHAVGSAADTSVNASVAAIMRAVEVGKRLVLHLMRFAGRQPVSAETIDLARYLPDLRELIKVVVGSNISVTVQVAPSTYRVKVDSSELELALINLALNARDAMPSGGELRVQARNAEPKEFDSLGSGAHVVVSVGDTGTGIAPDQLGRVFEPFFTTKDVGKGTGLGLSQVHGFCTQANGVARITSSPGSGTTVYLVLPASNTPVERSGRALEVTQPRLSARELLLVEDNEDLGNATQALLQSFGCRVQRARNAVEALEMIGAGQRFDVVLSDVVMPGSVNGVQLAHQLLQLFPALPVVLISGFSPALADDHGFTVLNKPCTPEELVEALCRAIGGSVLATTDASMARPLP